MASDVAIGRPRFWSTLGTKIQCLFTDKKHRESQCNKKQGKDKEADLQDQEIVNKIYTKLIRDSIQANSEIPFENGLRSHAAIIIREFVKEAKKSVIILCDQMATDVYGRDDVQQSFFDAWSRHVEIRILILKKSPQSMEFARTLDNLKGIDVKTLAGVSHANEIHENFMVIDEKMYRYEPEKKLERSIVCTNGIERSLKLTGIFTHLWATSRKIDFLTTSSEI